MANRVRKGILGEKLGMTQVWDEAGRLVPVTVVKAGPCVITQVRTPDKDGYDAIQLGYGAIDPRKVNKPLTGHYGVAGVPPRRHLVELRTTDASAYTLGQEVTAAVFEAGTVVDVVSTSKGKGFAGVMKRHGFGGLGAGHGVQRKHRSPGSIGACATPARVFKGTRMAGRLGNVKTTTLNLRVHSVDAEKGVVLIKGAVPGPSGVLVLVRSAAKAPAPEPFDPATLAVAPVEEAAAEQTAVEASPVDETPAEAAPVAETPVEAAATETPADEAPAEEAAAEEGDG